MIQLDIEQLLCLGPLLVLVLFFFGYWAGWKDHEAEEKRREALADAVLKWIATRSK